MQSLRNCNRAMKTKSFAAMLVALALGSGLVTAQVTVTSVLTNGLAEPYNVAVDANNNFYISDSVHNRILRVDAASGQVATVAGLVDEVAGSEDGPPYLARFNNPQGLVLATLGGVDGLFVSDTGNHTVRFVRLQDGVVSTVAGVAELPGNAPGGPGDSLLRYPAGLATDGAGRVYIADTGNHAIRVLDLSTVNLTTLAVSGTSFNQPSAVAFGAAGHLWVADTRNNMVKLIELTSPVVGTLKSVLGSGTVGTKDSVSGASASFNAPRGLIWWPGESKLLISDTRNHTLRLAVANPTYGADNYSVSTFAGVPLMNGLTDGEAFTAKFDTPVGLAFDEEVQGFLVADLKNNALRRIQNGPAKPAVANPRIGWVDFVWNDAIGTFVTLLRTDDQPRVFHNDVHFAILYERGTECRYTTANTPWPPGFSDFGENPSKTVGSTPAEYLDGEPKSLFDARLPVLEVERNATLGGLVIKAIGFQVGRPNSAIAKANYAFKVAVPTITGNNLASFKVTTTTVNPPAAIYYTVDGSEPTAASNLVPPGGQIQLNLPEGQTNVNVLFRARAFAPNYLPSDLVEKTFAITNFIPTRITLGFPQGEASSRFVASPGQTFYAPVTLQLAENATMYSLQFNLMITNLVGPPATGQLDFASMLYEEVSLDKGEKAPPGQGAWFRSIPPAMWSDTPTNRLIIRPSDPLIPLVDLTFYNPSLGVIGVGWIERWLFKDLYDTTKQDLIKYSIARDTLFNKANNRVVLGAGAFTVPATATSSARYQLTVGRPSATSDGVGAPGSQVFIANPASGYLTNGGFHAQRTVVMGQEKYIVGDVAPFRWLNAGDFGDTNLLNDDVVQVFASALYNLSPMNPFTGAPADPPYYSDLRDAMDAGPIVGVLGLDGNYHPAGPVADPLALFEGNDQTINSIAFGDNVLDVVDVYITFRRSLDPSLAWWRRFYADGVRVAEIIPPASPAPPAPAFSGIPELGMAGQPAVAETPAARFSAGDIQATAGQTIQIPIRVNLQGSYPLRVLMLGLTIQPLEGAPALEEAVQFTPVAALGQPTLSSAQRPGSYAAAWLNSQIAGLTGNALLGTLTVKVPAGAPAEAAYAIHFDHVSGSPNGLATFPQQILPGLITLSDRSASSLGDGISDAWRLRYFGSVHAILAAAAADADGDGHSNSDEFRAGTNPNDAASVLKAFSKRSSGQFAVRWPSVTGKTYVIERAGAIFSDNWLPVSTNVGTGWDMEFNDPDLTNAPRFYRVRVVE